VQVRLLGPLDLDPQGRGLSPRDRVVLSALALHPGVSCSADQLADALWRGTPPPSWAKVVQGCVMRLRRELGADSIQTTSGGYVLSPTAVELDVADFSHSIEQAREHSADGVPERAVPLLTRALGLWRGRPFEVLEDWPPGRLEAERLSELRRAAQEDLLEARLESGQHREVAAEGMVLVGEEPWRERRWAILALAQYRSGRQADALASIRRARRALDHQLGLDPGSELVRLERAILSQDPQLAADHEERSASESCPYKGLASYDLDDSESFFGRQLETAACLDRLSVSPLLVLAGPSGSGKSSLMCAGVGPALQRLGRHVVTFSPGADPAAALTLARAQTAGHPVLLVDQFEDVFTLGTDVDATRRWLRTLAAYATEHAPVVVTIRADHLSDLTLDVEFAQLAERGLHLVSPLAGPALREAIEGPAELAGLRLQDGLIDLLVRDAEDQPGALPLLSHALAETWQRREGRMLTVDGYRATGGIRGAVGRSADQLYESLSTDERPTLRWLLLRMVSLSDDGDAVRTRVARGTLASDPDRARILDLLVRARLVTAEEDADEIAHEALVRAWPRLRSWLDEDAAGQRIWRHLSTAADGWEGLGRPTSELYQGARLEATLEWSAGSSVGLTRREHEFLEASRDQAVSERRALEAQAHRQRRLNRRLRGLLAVVVPILLVALVAGLAAVRNGQTASDERDAANRAELSAGHEALVGRSLSLRATNRSVAALLAVEANRLSPDALSMSALLGTFTAAPGFLGYRYSDANTILNGVAVPGSDTAIVSAAGGQLSTLDLDSGALDQSFAPPPPGLLDYAVLRVSTDRRYLAQLAFKPTPGVQCGFYESLLVHNGRGCSALTVYSMRTGDIVFGPVVPPFTGGDVAISADGSMAAVVGGLNGDLAVYRVGGDKPPRVLAGLPRPKDVYLWRDTAAVAFGPDDRLYVGSMAGPIRVVDPQTTRVVSTLDAPLLGSHDDLVVTRDGRLIAVGDQAIAAFDLASGQRLWTVDLRDAVYPEPCPFFAVAEQVSRFYCGNYFGQLEERDLSTGDRTGVSLDPQLGSVGDLTTSRGGRELVAFGAEGTVYSRWRLDGSSLISRVVAPGRLSVGGFDPSGDRLLVARTGGVGADTESNSVIAVPDGATEAQLPGPHAGWIGTNLVAVTGGDRPGAYDLAAGSLIESPSISDRSTTSWLESDASHAWVATSVGAGLATRLDRIESATGQPTGESVRVGGFTQSAATSPDGSEIYVSNTKGERGWLTDVFDVDTGQRLRTGMPLQARIAISSDGVMVGADTTGDVTEFDPETLQPVAKFPGSRGGPTSLQFSADGSLLLVTSPDQSVQVYDVATRSRLGDALPSASLNGTVEGWLRPDGKAVAVNGRDGIELWSLDRQTLADAACTLAGRNLSRTEWETYVGADTAYRQTCPQFPVPQG
jgi:DNA-binding SARP family transcriptional activator/WD40 repeat protein